MFGINIRVKNRKLFACLAAGLFSFYNLFQLSAFNVISNHLLADFQLTTVKLGFLSSCFLWANALGLIPMGLLLDRYCVRKVGLCFLSLTCIASLIIGLAHTFSVILLMRFLQGLASAASLLIGMRIATQGFAQQAHLAVGFIVALALSGGLISNYGFNYLVNLIGWQQALLTASVVGIFIGFIMYLFLPANSSHQIEKPAKKFPHILHSLRHAISQPQNILGGILLGLMNAPIFVLATLWGNLYLARLYSLSSLTATSLSSFIFLGVMLGALFWGSLAGKRLTPLTTLWLGCSLALLLSLLLFSKLPLTVMQLSLLLLGLGFASAAQNIIYTLLSKTNQTTLTSTATGIATLLENGIGASLQILFGWLLNFMAKNLPGLLLFSIIFMISLILLHFISQIIKLPNIPVTYEQ